MEDPKWIVQSGCDRLGSPYRLHMEIMRSKTAHMVMAKHSVTLVPYNPDWPRWAELEADRLSRILGSNLITVEHIGSTSVPGLAAKPIIDLMPIVHDLNLLDQQKTAVEALGYQWFGEFGIPQRRYCTLTNANGERIAHLHFFPSTVPDIRRHLAFRDYLRAHPAVAEEYLKEKNRAAQLHPFDSWAYNQEKAEWVRKHEADAVVWFINKP